MSYRNDSSTRGSSARPSYRQTGPGAGAGGSRGSYRSNGPSRSKWEDACAEDDFNRNEGEGEYNAFRSVHDEPEDWDSSDWVQRKTQQVQEDSVQSTRRALQRINDSENIAMNNMQIINSQSEQLSNIETRLESAHSQVKVSDAKADHLKSLNRFFMIPSFGGKKAKKREEMAALEKQQYEAKLEEARIAREQQSRKQSRNITSSNNSKNGTQFYSTPDGIERDHVEEEIDGNLNQISQGLSRLKMMSQTMNHEITQQNSRITNIQDRTERTNYKLQATNDKVNRMVS